MPFLFLSPSTQDFNPYVTNGNEEYWMNELADRMTPYLNASGINVTRNDPSANAARSIQMSNEGNYDFHLALHSNASPEQTAGQNRGIDAYYYPASDAGLRMANILTDNLKAVYPLPDKVKAVATTTLGEVRRTKAPSVLVELGYHDNLEDEAWLIGNLDAVAAALSESVAEYFGVPFLSPQEISYGTVHATALNLRNLPDTDSEILTQIPSGERVAILGEYGDWYSVQYDGIYGFAAKRYIEKSV